MYVHIRVGKGPLKAYICTSCGFNNALLLITPKLRGWHNTGGGGVSAELSGWRSACTTNADPVKSCHRGKPIIVIVCVCVSVCMCVQYAGVTVILWVAGLIPNSRPVFLIALIDLSSVYARFTVRLGLPFQ